jgi:hypothetical protein
LFEERLKREKKREDFCNGNFVLIQLNFSRIFSESSAESILETKNNSSWNRNEITAKILNVSIQNFTNKVNEISHSLELLICIQLTAPFTSFKLMSKQK